MAILINDNSARVQYTATSGQTNFTVPFEFFSNSDLKVYVGSTLATYSATPSGNTQYSVVGAGVTGGGSITFGSPGITLSTVVTILRDIPVARTTDFPTSGPFPIDSLNTDLDKIVAIEQQLETKLDQRTLRIADTDTPNSISALPAKSVRSGKLLAFDSNGNPVQSTATLAQVDAIAGGSTLAVSSGGTGATTLTGYVKGNGTSAFTASASIPGTDITGNISGNAANVTGVVAVVNGGTGASNAPTARSNLSAAASGANTDIVSLGGITGGISTADFVDFDTAASVSRAAGRLWWDNNDNIASLVIGMAGSSATMNVGEQTYYRVKASSAITAGQLVMFTGSVGASGGLTAAPASGITKSTSSYLLGVAIESIALNGWGYVAQFGLVRNINTTGGAESWTDGTILYYNPAVAGGLTKNIPSAPNAKVQVAAVVYAHASAGSLFVRTGAGFELTQLNDVDTSSVTDLDLLQYNASAGRWVHNDPSGISVGSATNVVGGAANQIAYQTAANTTSFITAPTTSSTYLQWNGSAFVWAAASGGGGGSFPSITDSGSLVTVANPLTLSSPNKSAAAWTTSGINLIQSAATFTDTTSTGTVADVRINNFAAQTFAASSAVTATTLYGIYFANPIAGANVTATSRYAVGADSLTVNGIFQAASGQLYVNASGAFTHTGGSGTVTHTFASATTSSGNTKTINIGINGASGSTTAITLGSSTSGATQTTTINGRVTLAPIGVSAAAWTTSGIGLVQSAATFTDTTSTGTIGSVYINRFNAQTLAASNPITVPFIYGTYFSAPTAGANVTVSSGYAALGADSIIVGGYVNLGGGSSNVYLANSATTGQVQVGSTSGTGQILIGQSTASQTLNLHTGTTASGSTKTVNIGTGGASGSTTAITLGSNTSGATSTIALNGNVTASVDVKATNFVETVFAVTGTTPALDPTNGGIQTWTLSANSSPTDSLAAGESMTLMVNDGTAFTITWPTITWVGGTAPTLDTTKFTVIELWKVSTTLYGALVGFA